MSNCRESPADPVYWIFHCNHDYLWASWQHHRDRFQTDGTDERHYFPADAFAGSNHPSIPKGHHLDDTMWPWDKTSGAHPTLGANANRPSPNSYGNFPAAPTGSQLWPTGSATPKPADMIDYLGMASDRLELGFCYDQVPFGARSQPQDFWVQDNRSDERPLAARILGVQGIDAALQSEAAMELADEEVVNQAEVLRSLARNDAVPVDRRVAIVRRLFATKPEVGVRAGSELLGDESASQSLKLQTLDTMSNALHFSRADDDSRKQIMDAFRSQLDISNSVRMRLESALRLAAFQDKRAMNVMLEHLSDANESSVEMGQVILALRFYPEAKKRLIEELSSESDSRCLAAIEAVATSNPAELQRINEIAADVERSDEVRTAALQVIAFEHTDKTLDTLLTVASDARASVAIRVEAFTAIERFLDWNRATLSNEELDASQQYLENVGVDGPDMRMLRTLKMALLQKLESVKGAN